MPYYMLQVGYTPEAWGNMVKNPQDRLALVKPAIEKMGGKLVSGYWCFGEYDLVAITEMPDNTTAAAFSIAVAAGGAVQAIRTTPLMTARDSVNAMKKAGTSTYRPASATAKRVIAGNGARRR